MIQHVTLELDRIYNLRFGMGAMIDLERDTEIRVSDLQKGMTFEQCSKVLWIILRRELPELTLEQTIDLVDENATDLTTVIMAVKESMEIAFTEQKKKRIRGKKSGEQLKPGKR